MSKKLSTSEIQSGALMETTFWPNPVKDSGFRFRATHLDGRRAPKVVLCDDVRIRPGVPCQVKVKSITKKGRGGGGGIEVGFVRQPELTLEGVYLDPVASKKLQVLLESSLNVLLDG